MSKTTLDTITMPQSICDFATLERRLSLEETFNLADRARRKSTDKNIREDLRLKIGHENVLGSLLKDIAARSPPPSPTQQVVRMDRKPAAITWATEVTSVTEIDDYGFSYADDGAEDLDGLALCLTASKKPRR